MYNILSIILWICFIGIISVSSQIDNDASCSELNTIFEDPDELRTACEANDFCAFADFEEENRQSVCYSRCVQPIDTCFILDVSDSINQQEFEIMKLATQLTSELLFQTNVQTNQALPDGVDDQPLRLSVLKFAEDTEISIERRRLESIDDLSTFASDVSNLQLDSPDLGVNKFTVYAVGNCTQIFENVQNDPQFFKCKDLLESDPLCIDPLRVIFLITDNDPNGPTDNTGAVIQPITTWGPTIEDLGVIVFVAILTESTNIAPNLEDLSNLNNPDNQQRIVTFDISPTMDIEPLIIPIFIERAQNLIDTCQLPPPTESSTKFPTTNPTESLVKDDNPSCSELNTIFEDPDELRAACEANDLCAFADFEQEDRQSICYSRCVRPIDMCFILDVSDTINELDFQIMQLVTQLTSDLSFQVNDLGNQDLPDSVDDQTLRVSVLQFAEDTEISIEERRLESNDDLVLFKNDVNNLQLGNPNLGANKFTVYAVGNCTQIFENVQNDPQFFECQDLLESDPLCFDSLQAIFLITDNDPNGPTDNTGAVIQPITMWGPTIENLNIIVFVGILTESTDIAPNLVDLSNLNNPDNEQRIVTFDISLDIDIESLIGPTLVEPFANLMYICYPPTKSPTKFPSQFSTIIPTESLVKDDNDPSCSELNTMFEDPDELRAACEANDFCAFADFEQEGGQSICYSRCVQSIDTCFILDVSDTINQLDFEVMQLITQLVSESLFVLNTQFNEGSPDGVDDQPLRLSVLRFAEDTEISIEGRRIQSMDDFITFRNDVDNLQLDDPDLGVNKFTVYAVGNCTQIFQDVQNDPQFFQCKDLPEPDPLCVDPFRAIFLITDNDPNGPTDNSGAVIQPSTTWGPIIEELNAVVFVALLTQSVINTPNLVDLSNLNNPDNQQRIITFIFGSTDIFETIIAPLLIENFQNLVNTCEPPTESPSFPSNFPSSFPSRFPSSFPSQFPSQFPTESPTKFPTRFPTIKSPTKSVVKPPTWKRQPRRPRRPRPRKRRRRRRRSKKKKCYSCKEEKEEEGEYSRKNKRSGRYNNKRDNRQHYGHGY